MLIQTETKYNPATGKTGNLEYPAIDVVEINNGRIVVINSFSVTDELKNLGYKYDANRQAWYLSVTKATVKNELKTLNDSAMTLRLGALSQGQYAAFLAWVRK